MWARYALWYSKAKTFTTVLLNGKVLTFNGGGHITGNIRDSGDKQMKRCFTVGHIRRAVDGDATITRLSVDKSVVRQGLGGAARQG